jgi:hypothetical protein
VLSIVALAGLTALAIWERPARIRRSEVTTRDPAAATDTDA